MAGRRERKARSEQMELASAVPLSSEDSDRRPAIPPPHPGGKPRSAELPFVTNVRYDATVRARTIPTTPPETSSAPDA
jgi:hypothetical protein